MDFIIKNILIWIVVIFLIILSSFFSSSEIALSSCNKIRIKKLASEGNKSAKMVLKLNEQYGKALTALLIGNTVLNIIVTTIGAVIFTSYFKNFGAGISTVFFTVVLLIFAEIIPKTYANSKAEKICMKNVYFIYFSTILFNPLIFLFDGIRDLVNRFNKVEELPDITEQELKFMLEDIKDQGVLEDVEGKLARSALDLDEILVNEVMTPRVDLVAAEINEEVEKVKTIFLKEKFSRIPIYEGDVDSIVGIISEKNFFRQYMVNKNFKLIDIIEKPLLIPPRINILQLMRKFQKSKNHMAVVVDEYGGVEGIITFEDVIEQLVGEIYDEKDEKKQKDVILVKENKWKVNPDISVNVMFREISSEKFIESNKNSTVGGWILESLEKLPKIGDGFLYEDFYIKVSKMQENRIIEVEIEKKNV